MEMELEIRLRRGPRVPVEVDLRFDPHDAAYARRISGPTELGDQNALERIANTFPSPEAAAREYGEELWKRLLSDPAVCSFFEQITGVALAASPPTSLRVRLVVDLELQSLYGLPWETLRRPGSPSPLLNGETVYFSRVPESQDLRNEALRPFSAQKALIAVANPTDLGMAPGQQQLPPVNTKLEKDAARLALASLRDDQVVAIDEGPRGGRCTLKRIVDLLHDEYDILYLVCHGRTVDGGSVLYLENEDGTSAPVPGDEFVAQINNLLHRPRLIALSSCQSGGNGGNVLAGDQRAFAAVGPRLAAAGVPAVVAMQGQVQVDTARTFMTVFFREVVENGQIDRAAARARAAIYDAPDWWMPMLFMRFREGRIDWYQPRLNIGDNQKDNWWEELLGHVKAGNCTPILGPGSTEFMFGSRREFARMWAVARDLPLAPHQREDMPQVAQRLASQKDRAFTRREFAERLHAQAVARHRDALPEAWRTLPSQPGDEWWSHFSHEAWLAHSRRDTELIGLLARMPFRIFLTTNPDSLLEAALTNAGKFPQRLRFPWSVADDRSSQLQTPDPGGWTSNRPLVYHLFGELDVLESLVLTEDQHFDFLIGAGRNLASMPNAVQRAQTCASLLFIGFQLDDWGFRVLFRASRSLPGNNSLQDFTHVGVQIDPSDSPFETADATRSHLQRVFNREKIDLFWGNADDFGREVAREWSTRYGEDLKLQAANAEKRFHV